VLVARLGQKRNACKVLARKHEGKTLLERLKLRRKDNIKIGCEIVDCNNVVQDRNK